MDSRLLSAFHDDHYDGNYVKYESDTNFWPSENETLGLQLSETLHGILPISPNDDSSDFYNPEIVDKFSLQANNANANSYINYGINSAISPESIELISVDPNGNCDSLMNTEDDESSIGDADADIEDEYRSNSRLTFRSRTDSSSIADYESHTSDYDDDESDIEEDGLFLNDEMHMKMDPKSMHMPLAEKVFPDPIDNIVAPIVADSSMLQADAFDIDKALIGSTPFEAEDEFDMDIDANSFDLATFITQDDINFQKMPSLPIGGKKKPVTTIIESSSECSDSDSDVDIETVEVEHNTTTPAVWKEPESNIVPVVPVQVPEPVVEAVEAIEAEVDNDIKDPSWSPPKAEKTVKPIPKVEEPIAVAKPLEPVKVAPPPPASKGKKTFSMVPSKRQAEILKGKNKFGLGRGKNISMHKKPKATPTPAPKPSLPVRVAPQKKFSSDSDSEPTPPVPQRKPSPVKAKPTKIVETAKPAAAFTPSPQSISSDSSATATKLSNHPVKRKLNLEEYKKRREPEPTPAEKTHSFEAALVAASHAKPSAQKFSTSTAANASTLPKPSAPKLSISQLKPIPKLKVAVPPKMILPPLEEPKHFVDPILEAKNKVLRMQKLKKAQQIKIIDSAVSAKVGRVTKLPPLKDIVKGSYPVEDDESQVKVNPLYEEIIIVSAGCNTELTIPPVLPTDLNFNEPQSRSLLKSSALLYNISNTIQKVQSVDNVKLSSNSLISSIQDVVVKKTAPTPEESSGVIIVKKEKLKDEEHGEDKIIMHLRKDRIRKRKFSASTQTDILPEFPPLPLPVKSPSKREQNNRGRRKYRQHRRSSYSSDESSDRSRSYSSSRSRSSRSSRKYKTSRSISESSSSDSDSHDERERSRDRRMRNYSKSSNRSNSVISNSSAGSRLSRTRTISRSRSRSRCSNVQKGKPAERNVPQPAVEERRIVYVGRIEEETTKDDLRKKFIAYGPIKQITIHYKDTGMKYGFVTYDRAQDAFQVIDNGNRDADINMYDISFGGRRAFCRSSYADLDNTVMSSYPTYGNYKAQAPVSKPKEDDSFEALLMKVKAKMGQSNSQSKT